MILVDANLLLYAKIADYEQHERAHAWLDSRLGEPARVGIAWPSILAFLRISTNPRLFPSPLQTGDAWRQVVDWLALPQVWIPAPTERHPEILGQLLMHSHAAGPLVTDAHLAALCIEHGLVLCSTDGDFARFDGLRWKNPLGSKT